MKGKGRNYGRREGDLWKINSKGEKSQQREWGDLLWAYLFDRYKRNGKFGKTGINREKGEEAKQPSAATFWGGLPLQLFRTSINAYSTWMFYQAHSWHSLNFNNDRQLSYIKAPKKPPWWAHLLQGVMMIKAHCEGARSVCVWRGRAL